MDNLDHFLSNLSKQNKFYDLDDAPKVQVDKPINEEKIDGSVLFKDSQNKKSILDEIEINLTESEKKYFNSTNQNQQSLNTDQIRQIFREELSKYFEDKFLLKESGDFETIVFKIGNSVFKGNLELLK